MLGFLFSRSITQNAWIILHPACSRCLSLFRRLNGGQMSVIFETDFKQITTRTQVVQSKARISLASYF